MPDPIRKIALSRYALQRLAAHPEFAAEVDWSALPQPFSSVAIRNALAGSRDDDELAFKRRLRRCASACCCARWRAIWKTRRTWRRSAATMSELAEPASAPRWSGWRGELIVVAMGKLGGAS
jgi:hypothetical protein